MVDRVQEQSAEEPENVQELGSDVIIVGSGVVGQSLHHGTGMPGDSISITEAAETARDAGQDGANGVGNEGESLFDRMKEHVGNLIEGRDNKA